MIKLITCSDDRSGRKGGLYSATQDKIANLLDGFIDQHHYRLPEFIDCDPLMLNTDAAKNGRVYKPWCISQALASMNEGDYLAYNDCSPELWEGVADLDSYDLSIIQSLCDRAGGILVGFVKWDSRAIPAGGLGRHTHHFFTLDNFLLEVGGDTYRNSFQCASGMVCIKKSTQSMSIISDWLMWCRNPYYSTMNVDETENYWHDGKAGHKMGNRHDQSILSLMLNKQDWPYCDIVYNDLNPYNFLNFCLPNHQYNFINSNTGMPANI